MRRIVSCSAAAVALGITLLGAASKTLDIHFIDVEGGQATLLVTPAGQSMLIDAGFPGTGGFQARPGEATSGRDPARIAAVARLAGLSRIDYLLVTHRDSQQRRAKGGCAGDAGGPSSRARTPGRLAAASLRGH
jgi:beta-lactamase superfamily II metal-dependent hydrolase